MKCLIVVGSRQSEVCSIGSFARVEARELQSFFETVQVLEPSENNVFPNLSRVNSEPDYILLHSPSLYDRKKPWNALTTAIKLKLKFPKSKLITVVHEFSEAPLHWKARQHCINMLSNGVIVNTASDEEGVRKWGSRNVLRTRLGPTLSMNDLVESLNESLLQKKIHEYREELSKYFSLKTNRRWFLCPGLITPGKGTDQLIKIAKLLGSNDQLILMGGLGPKQRDLDFFKKVEKSLNDVLSDRFNVLKNLGDDQFAKFLVASDHVILPYDEGVSERRSSFLSALSCGANVMTTIGEYSIPLNLERAEVLEIPLKIWNNDENTLKQEFLKWVDEEISKKIKRRINNLQWAQSRTWLKRVQDLQSFFLALSKNQQK